MNHHKNSFQIKTGSELLRADASKLNSFHRKAAKAAEKRKGFQRWRNETGKSSGKNRHDHAHSWIIFFATLCGLGGFAVNPVFLDESALASF